MAKRKQNESFSKYARSIILCEGETEYWYFKNQLSSKQYKVELSKNSDAQKLVKLDARKMLNNGNWKMIYCVFDHDPESNLKEQLQSVNKIIKASNGKLQRVFSKPCFEIIFLFNFSNDAKVFASNKEVEAALNKQIQKNQSDYRYEKTEKCIQQLCEYTDFKKICNNAKIVCEKLKIDENNWLEIEEGYSEIFKLI
ncbi:MAG TPA: RloB family protein [Aquella sp.]|nr:RloB family protein [Aquella sp.]